MNKMKYMTASAATLTLMAGTAMAQNYNQGTEDTGLYIAPAYTYTYIDIETDNDVGDSTNAVTGRLGWQFTPNFAVEGEATFGIDDGEFDYNGDEDDFDFDANDDGDLNDALNAPGEIGLDYLAAVYGRYIFPVSDNFDLSARAGYAFAEIDSTIELDGTDVGVGASEGGFAFGAGAAWDASESQSIHLDYTRYEFDEANADAITAAYQFKF